MAGVGGGPIDGRPLILSRDLALELDVRVVVVGVVVRGDDCPLLISWNVAIFVGEFVGERTEDRGPFVDRDGPERIKLCLFRAIPPLFASRVPSSIFSLVAERGCWRVLDRVSGRTNMPCLFGQ